MGRQSAALPYERVEERETHPTLQPLNMSDFQVVPVKVLRSRRHSSHRSLQDTQLTLAWFTLRIDGESQGLLLLRKSATRKS